MPVVATAEGILRAKQIKESEALQAAWDQWVKTVKVSPWHIVREAHEKDDKQ